MNGWMSENFSIVIIITNFDASIATHFNHNPRHENRKVPPLHANEFPCVLFELLLCSFTVIQHTIVFTLKIH